MAGETKTWTHRAYVRFERAVLSVGMTVLAVAVERVLVGAIKKGGVEAAPRTAAGAEDADLPLGPTDRPEAEVGTSRPTV
jgi:hypothetical protein